MQITLQQAQAIRGSFIFGTKLPSATGYKFQKLVKLLQTELQAMEAERLKLIESVGATKSEDGTQFVFTDDQAPLFNEGMRDLFSTTVDIGVHFPLPLEAVGNLEFTPLELMQLEPLFDMEEK